MKADKTKFKIPQLIIAHCSLFVAFTALASADFKIDPSVMSEKYWEIWNDAEQAKIDADIEANRKADAVVALPVSQGTEVTVEQLDHEFKFGAHIFNFDQLGKKEYNDVYKASYGRGGIFNSATVAYYWNCYEPVPGRLRAFGDFEDTPYFWNSLTRDEAMAHPFWRRPAPGPIVTFCKEKGVRVHGHILIWGSAKPTWIYTDYCPENEKRYIEHLGIPRFGESVDDVNNWDGGWNGSWKSRWNRVYDAVTEKEVGEKLPEFTQAMRRIFRKRVFDVAKDYGELVDSWDVVNESSRDWSRYRKSRTGLPVWFSLYGLMPGDYPLHALLDAKEAFPAWAKLNINDYNICDDFLAQVKDLEQQGAKIDIVGCQMHIFNTNDCARLAQGETNINWVGTPRTIQDRLDMMAKTGKPIHVSEITITSPGSDARSRMIQAVLTRNIYRKWFSHKSLMGITWWNTVDGGGVKGEPLVSGLFTTDMKKKPAYEALDQLINHEWKTNLKVAAEGGDECAAFVKFRGFRGKYRLSWKDPQSGHVFWRVIHLEGDGIKETLNDASVDNVGTALPRGARLVEQATLTCKKGVIPLKTDVDGRFQLNGPTGYVPVLNADGVENVSLTFNVVAPRDMQLEIGEMNDWFGELTVNGGYIRSFSGTTDEWKRVNIQLKEGENTIEFKTRCGSSGNWWCSLMLMDPKNELTFK